MAGKILKQRNGDLVNRKVASAEISEPDTANRNQH